MEKNELVLLCFNVCL